MENSTVAVHFEGPLGNADFVAGPRNLSKSIRRLSSQSAAQVDALKFTPATHRGILATGKKSCYRKMVFLRLSLDGHRGEKDAGTSPCQIVSSSSKVWEMVQELLAKLKDGTSSERKAAVDELAKLGHDAAAARVPLVDALVDVSPAVRFAAVRALQTVGICAESAFPIVCEMIDDDEVRHGSALVIHALGLDGARGMELVREWIRDTDAYVRITAVRFMEFLEIEPLTEHTLLKEYVQSEADEENIAIALDRFNALGPASLADAMPLILSMALGGKASYEIANFLAHVVTPKATESLLTLLQSKNDECRLAAAECLLNVGGDPALKAATTIRELAKRNGTDDSLGERAAALLSTLRD